LILQSYHHVLTRYDNDLASDNKRVIQPCSDLKTYLSNALNNNNFRKKKYIFFIHSAVVVRDVRR
jgi:hypothetical protein